MALTVKSIPEGTQYYCVDFVYDHGQTFGTGAFLRQTEVKTMETMLMAYENLGCIEQTSIYEPTETDQCFDELVDEVRQALKWKVTDGDDISICPNCSRWWPNEIVAQFPVKDLLARVSPGEPMPSGECPACGSLCQPAPEDYCIECNGICLGHSVGSGS